MEGLAMWEKEVSRELICEYRSPSRGQKLTIHVVPVWSGVSDAKAIEATVAGIKADLLCELIGISVRILSYHRRT
jgi:hypothetical protein